jgi:hypothetical protein
VLSAKGIAATADSALTSGNALAGNGKVYALGSSHFRGGSPKPM